MNKEKKNKNSLLAKAKKVRSVRLEQMLKSIPIEISLKVCFAHEWLHMNVIPDRYHTEEEGKKAGEWAEKMTKSVLKHFREWEKNGRPSYRNRAHK